MNGEATPAARARARRINTALTRRDRRRKRHRRTQAGWPTGLPDLASLALAELPRVDNPVLRAALARLAGKPDEGVFAGFQSAL